MEVLATKNSFFRRSRKGKVLKLVHEHYIRDDVGFGFKNGSKLEEICEVRALLNASGSGGQKSLLVIDTNVALQEIDILEHESATGRSAVGVVIVLQTVLKEVKHLNLSVYQRLKALLGREDKSFIFFPNEVASATRVEQGAGESPNDANDRAIREASLYYQKAFGEQSSVIMLTRDQDNTKRATAQQLDAMSMRDYLASLNGSTRYPELVDLLAADGSSDSMMKMSIHLPT